MILAAGASERMGRCKALLKYFDETAIARLARGAREGGGAVRVVVVASQPHLDIVKDEAQRLNLGVVVNRSPEKGRTGSVQMGLTAVRDSDLAFIAPVDYPLAEPDVFRTLRDAMERSREAGENALAAIPDHESSSGCPVAHGRGGHPILLARDSFELVASMKPDDPLRELYSRPGAKILRVRTSVAIGVSVDTPEEYDHAVNMHLGQKGPQQVQAGV